MRLRIIPAKLLVFLAGGRRKLRRACVRPLFARLGEDVHFSADDEFSYARIYIGNRVYIGPGAYFSTITRIEIGNDVVFGPGVYLIGGDHNTALLGRPMSQVHEKRPGDDQPIVIENDVWVGARATILKGVKVGRGAVIAASSLVTADVPPYAIVAGIPARVLRMRGSEDEIATHEAMLGKRASA